MAAGVRIVYVRTPAVCFRLHIVLLSISFYAKVLNSVNFSLLVMGYLENCRIFVILFISTRQGTCLVSWQAFLCLS